MATRSYKQSSHECSIDGKRKFLAALTRLFGACSRQSYIPPHTMKLLPQLLSPAQDSDASNDLPVQHSIDAAGRQNAWNALLFACGQAGHTEAAWTAFEMGKRCGLSADRYTVTALVNAAGRARDASRLHEAIKIGRDAAISIDTDPYTLTAVRANFWSIVLFGKCPTCVGFILALPLYSCIR